MYFFNLWKLIKDLINHDEEKDEDWEKVEKILKRTLIGYSLVWLCIISGIVALLVCDIIYWQSITVTVLTSIGGIFTIIAVIYNVIKWFINNN